MSPPSIPPDSCAPEDALFALVLQVAERILDLAASADRGGRLEELTALTTDLDLFAKAAGRTAAYTYLSSPGSDGR